jgi:hypothetical protein
MQVLLATRKGLLTLEIQASGARIVRQDFPGVPVAYAAADPRTGTWWATLDHGHWGQKLQRSRDRGATWEEVPAPQYPAGAEIKPGVPASLRYLWVMAPGGQDQPGRLYLGTEPGGLFRSDDGGDTWSLVEGLWNHPSRTEQWMGGGRDHPGIHSVLVDPRDSRRIQVGISCAGMFESTDDGVTWAPKNRGLTASFLPDPTVEVGHDPHRLVNCTAKPDVLWQQNHCGIFRSEDGGAHWQDISQVGGPAYFGFAIAADPLDARTAWVVPAAADERRMAINGALCVCRTTDGGRSWVRLFRGLPQEHAYDIVLRHALEQQGDALVFGSTTGNVYFSGDRGDSWRSLGHHFPPIYSVYFLNP